MRREESDDPENHAGSLGLPAQRVPEWWTSHMRLRALWRTHLDLLAPDGGAAAPLNRELARSMSDLFRTFAVHARLLARDREGRVLLVKRLDRWYLPGALIQPHESPTCAIVHCLQALLPEFPVPQECAHWRYFTVKGNGASDLLDTVVCQALVDGAGSLRPSGGISRAAFFAIPDALDLPEEERSELVTRGLQALLAEERASKAKAACASCGRH